MLCVLHHVALALYQNGSDTASGCTKAVPNDAYL